MQSLGDRDHADVFQRQRKASVVEGGLKRRKKGRYGVSYVDTA